MGGDEWRRDRSESDTEHMEPADSRRRLQQLVHVDTGEHLCGTHSPGTQTNNDKRVLWLYYYYYYYKALCHIIKMDSTFWPLFSIILSPYHYGWWFQKSNQVFRITYANKGQKFVFAIRNQNCLTHLICFGKRPQRIFNQLNQPIIPLSL